MPRNSDFQTVHTEGGLLPADQLSRIATSDASGVSPAEYDLPPGEKVNEAISQCWARLRKHWADFQNTRASLPGDRPGTDVTNQKWLLPLFRELGYGKLTTSKAPEIDGKTYPITRFYGQLPIHFVGCNIALDKRSPGVKGAATGTPHGLVQEFLNRTDGHHLWAFVSNGSQLRILRDNVALSRQSFIEFDLESMFDGEVYSDFALLWMVCHVTRTEGERPELCWLEKWSTDAREHGTRVLENLRVGVERAIEALGRGFVSHPANDTLRQKLRDGQLDKQDLYHQVLRTVYRLLFLFVAEDRNLLHPPETPDAVRVLYYRHYSTRRLRDLAGQIKGSRHGDLWHVLSLTFTALSGDESTGKIRSQIGLPALGSRLWRIAETNDINGPGSETIAPVQLSNDDLLDAIRHLAYVQQERTLQSVNYRDLGSEELGSVYESLLELQPDIHPEARKFELRTVTGSERKTTGSYYTPDSLVQRLLDSALEPVINERIDAATKPEDEQQALLDLKVCDPACGSGHFLIAAAHRLARHLARIRTIAAGEVEPTPEIYQHALRDVIAHCIYGVDINPMAVELCKVSLWLEALDPGRPLAFLDHHIQCGNSLLGTTPALIAKGIPDNAFKPIEGDNKAVCRQLKKANKSERRGQRRLWGALPSNQKINIAQKLVNINAEDDSTPAGLAKKEKHYREFVFSSIYENAYFLADAWCAAFFWPKTDPHHPAITTDVIRRIEDNPNEFPEGSPIREDVQKLSNQYQFFHWHIVFPDVFRLPSEGETAENEQAGWSGGFDCVLGNPPWERVELSEKDWFGQRDSRIAKARTGALRKRMIAELSESNPSLYLEYSRSKRFNEATNLFIRCSERFPLCGQGRVNTFSVFAETNRMILCSRGSSGFIVPSGIVTDDSVKAFVQELISSNSLVSVFDFENRKRTLFPDVYYRMRFCLVTITGIGKNVEETSYAFLALSPNDLDDPARRYTLSAEDIQSINPETLTCPLLTSAADAHLVLKLHKRFPALGRSSWEFSFKQGLFNITSDSGLFQRTDDLVTERYSRDECAFAKGDTRFLPLYEGRMVSFYDHRTASVETTQKTQFRSGVPVPTTAAQQKDPAYSVSARFWVHQDDVYNALPDGYNRKWFLSFKDVTSATNARTAIGSIIPFTASGNNLPLIFLGESAALAGCFLANFNSLLFDYLARTKVSGNHLLFFMIRQLPFVTTDHYSRRDLWSAESIQEWVLTRGLELTFTSDDVRPFAQDCFYDGPPFVWIESRRFHIQCELNAAYFHLYLGNPKLWNEMCGRELKEFFPTPRNAVEHVLDSFRIVRERDEQTHGYYRTKDTILQIYDEMAEAIAINQADRMAGQLPNVQYQSRLDPPPGPPADATGKFIPYADWTGEIRDRYKDIIHPPMEARE